MKLISWNVNGIRAVLKKGFLDFVEKEKPDVLCLQEIKAHPEQVDAILEGYKHHYWNPAQRNGYSGTAIFSKEKILSFQNGIGIKEYDDEGRVLTVELNDFYLVDVYNPNSKRGLTRLEYRRKWNKALLNYLKKLEGKKPVIACGDFNVAHKEIDIANPSINHDSPGFTDEEREDFDSLLNTGFVDTFREFDKSPGKYTWWTYMFHAREKNIGWRIDYFIASKALMSRIKNSFILPKVMGSDHCPIVLEL